MLSEHVSEARLNELVAEAPKHRILRHLETKKKPKVFDIQVLLNQLRSNYDQNQPSSIRYIRHVQNVGTLEELLPHLQCSIKRFREIENFYLKNGYLFGKWLKVATKLYRYERFVKKEAKLPSTFERWLKQYGISKSTADVYKRLTTLVDLAEKLVNCNVSVKFIMQNFNALMTFFQSDSNSVWRHKVDCHCGECIEYFNISVS